MVGCECYAQTPKVELVGRLCLSCNMRINDICRAATSACETKPSQRVELKSAWTVCGMAHHVGTLAPRACCAFNPSPAKREPVTSILFRSRCQWTLHIRLLPPAGLPPVPAGLVIPKYCLLGPPFGTPNFEACLSRSRYGMPYATCVELALPEVGPGKGLVQRT